MTRLREYINRGVHRPELFVAAMPQEQSQETPQVDTTDTMASLAQLMGPTPAEREAAERRMLQSKAKMAAWTGLFDGLRQLGNLYYATKGATPQKYDNPYTQVEQNYQQQRQLYNDIANYRKNYATSLYTIRRQMEEEKRKNKLSDAQAQWYGTREEMARAKADSDAVKAEAYAEAQRAKANGDQARAVFYETKAKALEEGYPYDIALKKAREAQARASANLSNTRAANVGAEVETIKSVNPDGSTKTNKRTVRNGGTSVKKSKTKETKGKGTNNSGFFNK